MSKFDFSNLVKYNSLEITTLLYVQFMIGFDSTVF